MMLQIQYTTALFYLAVILLLGAVSDSSPTEDNFARSDIGHEEQIPPSVLEPRAPRSEYISAYDENVKVKCKAEGNPKPTIAWYRDGVKLTNAMDRIQIHSDGTLLLEKFYSDDSGYFHCRATNPLGTSLSDIITIQAEQSSGGSSSEAKQEVTEFEPWSLHCDNMPHTVPKLLKRWYFEKNKEVRESKRIGIDLNGTLHFAYTMKADAVKYTCGLVPEVSLGIKTQIFLFPKGEIIINQRETNAEVTAKPTLAYSVSKVKAIIGRKAILQCFFSAKPTVSMSWKNSNNQNITEADSRFTISDFGRKLIIDPVSQLDEGLFTCTGENYLGSAGHTITVNVTTPPLPASGGVLTAKTTPDNRDITLPCKSTAASKEVLDTPKWYRNGLPLNQRNVPNSRYKFNKEYTELRIQGLNKEEDTANFQCNTSNSEGYLFYDAYLRVIRSIVITKRPADVNEIQHGDVVDISIQAKGDYCCPISMLWKFNGTSIADIGSYQPFQIEPDSDRLLFNSSRVTEGELDRMVGLYTCWVSNQHQSVPVHFRIIPKMSMTSPVEEGKRSGIEMWWIALLGGILFILIAVIVVVIVYKSYYPGSTYKLEEQEIKHNLNPEEDLLNQSFHEI